MRISFSASCSLVARTHANCQLLLSGAAFIYSTTISLGEILALRLQGGGQFSTQMGRQFSTQLDTCTPAAGWEKGQVENQVKTSRCNFFTPLIKVEILDELNQKLEQLCLEWAKKTKHPEFKEQTVWDIYQQEK